MFKTRWLALWMAVVLLSACGKTPNKVTLYTVDPNGTTNDVNVIVEVQTKDEVSPEKVVELFVSEILGNYKGAEPLYLAVTQKEDWVNIDFSKSGLQYVSAGSFMEMTTLDGLAKSVILNNDSVNSVSYSVAGEGYASGHFEFPKDYIYATREDVSDKT